MEQLEFLSLKKSVNYEEPTEERIFQYLDCGIPIHYEQNKLVLNDVKFTKDQNNQDISPRSSLSQDSDDQIQQQPKTKMQNMMKMGLLSKVITEYLQQQKQVTFKQKLETYDPVSQILIRALLQPPINRNQDNITCINNFLKKQSIFNDLEIDETVLITLVKQVGISFHKKGRTVCEYGDTGDYFYIIIQGSVRVMVPNEQKSQLKINFKLEKEKYNDLLSHLILQGPQITPFVIEINIKLKKCKENMDKIETNLATMPSFVYQTTLKTGDSFGEQSMKLNNPTRSATYLASSDVLCAIIGRSSYIKILEVLRENKKAKMIQLLRQFQFFNEWQNNDLLQLAYLIRPMKLNQKNSIIFQEGNQCDYVVIVNEGEFYVSRKQLNTVFVNQRTGTIKIQTENGKHIYSNEILQSQENTINQTFRLYQGSKLHKLVSKEVEKSIQNKTTAASLLNKNFAGSVPELMFAQIGHGYMFGQDDIIQKRPATYSLKSKTRYSSVYVINRADFLHLVWKNEQTILLKRFLLQHQTKFANKLAVAINDQRCVVQRNELNSSGSEFKNYQNICKQKELFQTSTLYSLASKPCFKSIIQRQEKVQMSIQNESFDSTIISDNCDKKDKLQNVSDYEFSTSLYNNAKVDFKQFAEIQKLQGRIQNQSISIFDCANKSQNYEIAGVQSQFCIKKNLSLQQSIDSLTFTNQSFCKQRNLSTCFNKDQPLFQKVMLRSNRANSLIGKRITEKKITVAHTLNKLIVKT